MTETFLAGGKSIPLDVLGTADSPIPAAALRPAIVLLHGAGGNVGFWLSRLEPALREANIALFAPHYFARTGTSRADLTTISDGVHVPLWLDTLDAALSHVRSRPGVDPGRIALVGISLGAFLSLAHAAGNSASADELRRRQIRCIVALSGGLAAPYATQATSAFPPTLILHGAADTIVPASQASDLDRRLTQLHVPHETHILPSEGHWFSSAAQWQLLLAVSAFLQRHL